MVSPIELIADFRSDTLTLPSEAMKAAMITADLGDDVFGEDPAVNLLQSQIAGITGKQAGLFFPSGTMANIAALMSHTRPGQLLYAGANSHIHHYELGGYARLAGLALKEVDDSQGFLSRSDLEAKWNPDIYYMPQPGLVAVENTHNMLGGKIYPIEELRALSEFAKKKQMPLHMDGARLFHAAAGAQCDPKAWTAMVDSVMISMSKGLGCPVGSVLVGSREMIEKARVFRKLLGGGMRQAGVLAVAGSFALAHHLDALRQDVERCRRVFAAFPKCERLQFTYPQTNILIGTTATPEAAKLVQFLEERDVRSLAISSNRLRFVFHLNNSDAGCDALVQGLQAWLEQ